MSFCFRMKDTADVMDGAGDCHARHSRQVSMMPLTMLSISCGSPAALSMRCMGALPACHHLKCSFLSSFFFCTIVPTLMILKLLVTSKDVQSLGFSPVALVAVVG